MFRILVHPSSGACDLLWIYFMKMGSMNRYFMPVTVPIFKQLIYHPINLNNWIKKNQLDVTCFIISLFNAQHVLNVSTSIFRSLRPIVDLFHVLGGWSGVVSLCRLKQCFSLHKDTTPLQPNHTVTPTHIEPEQCNPWNNSGNKLQAPEDGCTNIRNTLSSK